MKNIFSKTTENRTQNGVKSYLSPTFVLSPILIFAFLTLGVGQMWADITYSGGHIYFDNSLGIDDNTLQICARQSNWTGVSSFSNIDNTKLYYVKDPQGSGWGGILGWVVISANPAKSNSDFDNWSYYAWCSGWNTYGFNSGSTYLIVPSSKDKNQSVTTTYCDGGYGAIPKYNATQGAKWRDTGTSYSITTGTYPATLKLQGTYLSGNGKSARSTITSTASTDGDAKKVYGAVVTGEITHSFESLNSSYYFEGWGTGSTPSSTENTYSYNISENTTTYAFFSKTYTLTYDRKGTFGNSTLSVDVSDFNGTKESGSAIPTGHQITFTATPASGYVIEGWYSDAECTKSLDNGQNTTYTISSLDADRSVYVKFEQLKTITIKFAHEATEGWTIQGVRKYPESGGQSISANGIWVTMEFTNVYAVSNIDLAYKGGGDWDDLNTATKITGNCCYNKDGSLNASCCVSAPSLTWTTAPADGYVDEHMTAVVNTTPVSGGSPSVTWSTSNSNIAAVNESTGVISYVAAGSATITAHVTWSATGDYCAGSYDLTKEISCTSGATVSVERTCAAYVAAGVAEQVSAHITFTGTSSGWKYRIKQSWSAGYETGWLDASGTSADWTMTGGMDAVERTYTVELYTSEGAATPVSTANFSVTGETAYNTTIAAGANGSVSPSGTVYANNNHVHPTITATPNEHYHFVNWTSNNAAASVADDNSATTTVTATASGYTITANFAGDKYTITYKDQGGVDYSGNNIGSLPATHTYGTATDLVNGTKEGFTFGGWYTDAECTGEAVTSIGATAKTSNFTLYAKWTPSGYNARITFVPGNIVAPGATVSVTAFVEPTPEEPTTICWRVLYSNDNPLDPQPTFTPANQGEAVSFIAPEASGSYKVEATLRKGTGCGGEEIHTFTAPFQVAGDHTVTVQYKCGDVTLQGSTSVSARPLDWSEDITPDEIFGYSFEKWVAGDGVTMTIDGGETTINTGGETTGKDGTHAVQIKAIYDGKLIAQYTKKNIIYFKNTLKWNEVYVNLYPYAWWNSSKGAGNETLADDKRNKKMTQLGETDIWYYEYGNTATTAYVSFTDRSQNNYTGFAGTSGSDKVKVSYPTRPYATAAEDANYGFNAGTPMFVPTAGQTAQPWNKSGNDDLAEYYNKGYWRKYDPIQGETGYTLKVYNMTEDNGRTELKSIKFVESDVPGQLFKAVANLEAAGGYGIKFERDNSMLYTNISGHLQSTGDVVVTEKQDANYRAIWIKATAAGDYTFAITINGDGKLCIQAEFPVAKDDYRVIYTDNATWTTTHTLESWIHPSRIITAEENAVDTISFFVSKGHSPEFKIQKVNTIDAGTGAIEWTDVTDWTSCDDVDASGVYNFIFTQDGSKNISFTKKEPYTGNFYIRTDAAGSTKWDNYRAPDHLMTYSEYSKDHSDYTHYFVKFVREGKNVKFVVANDYSPCISDTLIRQTYRGGDRDHVDENGFLNGDLPGDGVNVRYMWDIRNNAVYRAYLAPAQKNGSKFLVLRSNSSEDLRDEYDVALTGDSEGSPGNNHGGGANCMQFVDNENWIYEATVMVRPSAYVKLYGYFHGTNFYFKGNNNNDFNDTKIEGIPNAIQLVTGSTGARVKVRVIYDFKTDRLVAAYLPSGNIDEEMAINADVMFIREHQGDIDQLTFSEKDSKMGSITDIKTAYAVMRFNKWTLNNKEKTGSNDPLASPASIYERSLYYVSFPFPVNLNEVFGFGTYGQHWIIQRYRGDLRAQQGFWAESAGFWEFIWNRNGVVLQPNEGYILTLETELLGEESDVWGPDQRSNQIELFFPSTGPLGSITNSTVNCTIPEHTCTINRAETEGLPDPPDPSTSYNRTIFDSHWNIMSVPTYVNVDDPSFANTTWIGGSKGNVGPKFLYTWNMNDNTLTATSGTDFVYHAMHAYTVQYYGDVTWTTSVTPPAAPQRNTEYRGEYEFCLEVQQDDQMIDRTYVRLSDDENVTTGFEFSEDMTKQFNSRKANIFTIAGNTSLGGNSLPLSTTQTTVVPVGVKIKTAGDYTFAIPEGTDGIGVTLVDNETGVRTLLSALDYTVNLTAGTHDGRFILEISPIQNTPTGMEEPTSDSSLKGRAQKRIIDGVLYIVKDGKIFDARGTRVE